MGALGGRVVDRDGRLLIFDFVADQVTGTDEGENSPSIVPRPHWPTVAAAGWLTVRRFGVPLPAWRNRSIGSLRRQPPPG